MPLRPAADSAHSGTDLTAVTLPDGTLATYSDNGNHDQAGVSIGPAAPP
jgi:hypothetical protein